MQFYASTLTEVPDNADILSPVVMMPTKLSGSTIETLR